MVVKDFDHFENHKLFIDPTVDELFGNSLFLMRGERWRDMRATLSPAFTGSKMRLMFDMVSVCAADMVKVLSERTVSTEGGVMRAPVKELFGRYTTDVIATAAFGIKVNSFVDEKNEFFEHGRRMMNFANFKAAAKLVIISASPKLARYFKVGLRGPRFRVNIMCILFVANFFNMLYVLNTFFKIELMDREASQFFRSMALDTMRTRLEQGIYRPDMINLLMELKAGGSNGAALKDDQIDNKKEDRSTTASDKAIVDGFATVEESHIGRGTVQREWSDTELAAQCFLFFAAGFDTTSTALSFLCYELAVNQDVQKKLFEECQAVQDGLPSGTPLSYDQLQRMQYMDQVVSESLRMWPPVLLTDRECTKDYIYEDAELRFGVLAGEVVMIPVFAMHRDEHFFAEPDRFQPERFGEERKSEIVQGSYLPFGVGPRNCIGECLGVGQQK